MLMLESIDLPDLFIYFEKNLKAAADETVMPPMILREGMKSK